MIAYLDASALVKRYITERGSDETLELTATAEVVATSLVSRAEVASAFAKAVRRGLLLEGEGHGHHPCHIRSTALGRGQTRRDQCLATGLRDLRLS